MISKNAPTPTKISPRMRPSLSDENTANAAPRSRKMRAIPQPTGFGRITGSLSPRGLPRAKGSLPIMRAMVMAAGLGTRLRPLTYDVPKPLVSVVNRPIMEHVLELLSKHGFREVIANLHWFGDLVR